MAERIKQKWAAGTLVFYEEEGADRTTTGYPLLSISPTEVTVGGSSNDIDFRVFLGSGSEYILFNAGTSTLEMGYDGEGVDVKFFGDTASSYALWDESADKLILEAADLRLGDSDIIELGDAADITLTWDGTRLNVNQATVNSEIRWGIDGAGIDQRWYGDTASSYMLWDQSADKLIINAGTADLGTSCEADAYTVGGTAGLDYNAAVANITVVKGIVTAAS